MENDLISIIIPLYNKEKYIINTIESVIAQSYTNWEIIIIDDFSTDRSYEIAKSFEADNLKVIKNEENIGPALTRNKGLDLIRGKYLCFQDADDMWNKYKLEKQIEFMKKKDCAFSYTDFEYIKNNRRKTVKVQKELDYKEALKRNKIITASTMFDLTKINKELLYMPDIPSEDVATWWNILKKGYKAYGLNENLTSYVVAEKSLTSNKFKSAKNRWNLYRKFEKFNVLKSVYYFSFYILSAVLRRI